MCNFASIVLTKERAFWELDTDSHSEIIARNRINEAGVRGLNVVKVEITPGPRTVDFDDLESWDLKFDQDQFPEWHDPVKSEERARRALAARAKAGWGNVTVRSCAALTTFAAPKATSVDVWDCAALTTFAAHKATSVVVGYCDALKTFAAPKATSVNVWDWDCPNYRRTA